MKAKKFTRRQLIATTSAGVIGTMINLPLVSCVGSSATGKLALLGGEKVHKGTCQHGQYGIKLQKQV